MKPNKEIIKYFEESKFGAALEVVEALMEEGLPRGEAEQVVKEEISKDPGSYSNPDEFTEAVHNTYGYVTRMNQVLNSIREMIQSDVLQVLKSGHKPQILALRESLVDYVKIIDEAKEA